jgi:very-short-patch-repair endonuclease
MKVPHPLTRGMTRRKSKSTRPHPLAPSPNSERENGLPRKWSTSPSLWEKLKPVARQMRREPTEAENRLWQHLRNRRMHGFKFRRQHSIERFIVDFYCAEARLVIEVDGPIHQYQASDDLIREDFLKAKGLCVLRFTNDSVLHGTAAVLLRIRETLASNRRSSPSPKSERGIGG